MKPKKLSDRPEQDPVAEEPSQAATAVAEEPQFDNGPDDPETDKVIAKVERCVTDGMIQSRGAEEILSAAPLPVARNWIVNLQSMWLPRDVNIDVSAGCATPEEVLVVLHKMLDKAIKDIKPTR